MVHRAALRWTAGALVWACVLTGAAAPATAAGLIFPGIGSKGMSRGAAYIARTNGPEAAWYNPANLTLSRGHWLYFNNALVNTNVEFVRKPSDDPDVGKNFDGKPVENTRKPFYIPFVSFGSDFGTSDWTFSFAGYGPNGGDFFFDPTSDARHQLIDSQILEIWYSFNAAYNITDRLRFGVGFYLVQIDIQQRQVLNIDQDNKGARNFDLFTEISVRDYKFNVNSGISYDILNDNGRVLTLGASFFPHINVDAEGSVGLYRPGQPQLAVGKDLGAETAGQKIDKAKWAVDFEKDPIHLQTKLPWMLRAGLLYGQVEDWEAEAAFVYEAWSRQETVRIKTKGLRSYLEEDSTALTALDDIVLPREFTDSYTISVGGEKWLFNKMLRVRLGYFFEKGSVPDPTTTVSLPDKDKHNIGGGFTVSRWGMDLDFTYSHIFMGQFDVKNGKFQMENPIVEGDSPVVNNGVYNFSYDVFMIALTAHFDQMFGDGK